MGSYDQTVPHGHYQPVVPSSSESTGLGYLWLAVFAGIGLVGAFLYLMIRIVA